MGELKEEIRPLAKKNIQKYLNIDDLVLESLEFFPAQKNFILQK